MRMRLIVAIFVIIAGAAAANPQYLPHVVTGGGYVTTVTVTNLLPDQSQWVFLHFYKEDGARWTVPSNMGSFNRLDFELAPQETATAVIAGQFAEIQTGWALAVGGGPFLASSAYQYTVDNTPTAMAGVLSARSATQSVLPAFLDTTGGVDTGVALINPTDTSGDATLILIDALGQTVGTRTVALPAKGKYTAFLSAAALFPGIPLLDGYLQVESMLPVAAMGLRVQGTLFSSLPAVQDFLPWRNANTFFVNPLLGNDTANDGTLAKPFKTIKKAQSRGVSGAIFYLMPGLYNAASGETFPIVLAYCTMLRGADVASVCIQGDGTAFGYPIHSAVVGEYKSIIADLTVINPQGVGIYAASTMTIDGCRVTGCTAAGIELVQGCSSLLDTTVTGNSIGVHVGVDSDPDLGGGMNFGPGGNFITGNIQCDLWIEAERILGLRFNSWDHPIPVRSTVCSDGADIVAPYPVAYKW